MNASLDRRLNAFRPDLAEIALEGQVDADRFSEGEWAHVAAAVADMRSRPDLEAGIDTQLILGENVRVFDRHEGWAWVKAEADSYVGYVSDAVLDPGLSKATHRVIRQRTFLYPGPDLRFPPRHPLSIGSRIEVVAEAVTRGTRYLRLASGEAVVADHCATVEATPYADPLAVAALFLETPYLWGGRTGFGIDCSGLVQIALAMTGKSAPRDSDMQAAWLGEAIDPARDGLRRGDLVFWKGHVAMVEDTETIIHASGATMTVTREPLKTAITRIEPLYGPPTGYRRP